MCSHSKRNGHGVRTLVAAIIGECKTNVLTFFAVAAKHARQPGDLGGAAELFDAGHEYVEVPDSVIALAKTIGQQRGCRKTIFRTLARQVQVQC